MNLNNYQLAKVIKSPIISEKSSLLADNYGQYAFKVEKKATKIQIKSAVELMFGVEVDSVHVLNVNGKQKRFGRSLGRRSDWKKAYVKLKSGHEIDFSAA